MTTLALSRISFEARHGATEAERKSLRPFEVDVTIEAPVDLASKSDRLDDTVDYRAVAEIIVAVGTGETHHLLEALADRILAELVGRFPNARFHLEVRKPSPPDCPGHPAYAAVRMSRGGR
jgi:7,8-dihydroneopterin aldolase/epimerase/oxygenase